MCLKNFFDDDKKFYLQNKFFVSNQNFTTKHVKIVKNSRFFHVFFCLNCQIPDISRLSGNPVYTVTCHLSTNFEHNAVYQTSSECMENFGLFTYIEPNTNMLKATKVLK